MYTPVAVAAGGSLWRSQRQVREMKKSYCGLERHSTNTIAVRAKTKSSEAVMSCQSCGSVRNRLFNGEVAIHFPGFDGLNNPIVWVFPNLTVCLDCGQAKFNIPGRELQILMTGCAAAKSPAPS
jgi:hypothetical protein